MTNLLNIQAYHSPTTTERMQIYSQLYKDSYLQCLYKLLENTQTLTKLQQILLSNYFYNYLRIYTIQLGNHTVQSYQAGNKNTTYPLISTETELDKILHLYLTMHSQEYHTPTAATVACLINNI